MKICYIADIMNSHARRWAARFAALGHETLVLSDYVPPNENGLPEGVRAEAPQWTAWEKMLAFKLDRRPYGNNRWKYLAYRRALKDFRPDVIHGMEALFNGVTTARLLGPKGPPRILMPWGNDIEYDPFHSPYARKLVQYALRNVEHIVGNRPGMEDFLLKHFGVPREKVTGFSWGVDLSVFRSDLKTEAAALREKLCISRRARVILSPRNFSAYWGIENIVKAVPLVVKQNPNAYFILLTGAADQEFLKQNLIWLEWQKRMHHVHIVNEMLPPSEIATLFNLAEVFVSVPETDFLALTLMEGMACGCVPVCRDLEVYRQRVAEKVTGRYVPSPLTPEAPGAGRSDSRRLGQSRVARRDVAQCSVAGPTAGR